MATIPVPFGKSPSGVFPSVNWGDPITKKLVVANHVDGIKGIDLVSRQPFEWMTNSVGATPVPNNTRFGTATACLHDYGYWGGGTTYNPIAATDDVTVLMWAREDATLNRGFFRRGKDGSGNGWSLYLKTENSACNPSFGVVWTSPGLVGRAVTNAAASINASLGSEGMWLLGRYTQGVSLSIFCGNGTVAHDTTSVGSSLRTSTAGISLTGNTTSTADNGNFVHFYGTVGNDQFIWARALSDQECWEILADPLRVYRRRDRVAVLVTAAGGTTSGAIAANESTDTGSVTATVTTGAAVAATDSTDTASIGATVTTGAAISATETTDAASITGNAAVGTTSASIAATESTDTASVAGQVTTGAAVAATDYADLANVQVRVTTGALIAVGETTDACSITTTGGASPDIWTDINRSSTSWSNLSPASSTWTNL